MGRILVVEPLRPLERSGYDFLKARGYHLEKVRDLKTACDVLATRPVEALLVHRTLLNTNQRETVSHFFRKARERPLILLGEGKESRGITQWLHLGADLYLPSPYTEGELLHLLRRLQELYRLRRDQRLLDSELQQSRRELAFFVDVGRALTSTLDLKKVLHTVMEKTRRIIRAEAWSILLVDEENQELTFEAATGKKAKEVKKFRLKVGQGIAGWVAKEGLPLIVPDVSKDARFFGGVDKAIKFKTRSVLAVPLITKKKVIGVLEVINKLDGGAFTKQDLDLLMKLVDQASIAVEHASLYQKMAELAITDDLTNLFNLRYLTRTVDMEIERSNRYGSSVSVIFVDMDFFKAVNDTYGHLAGSRVLIEVAQILLKNLRGVDVVARYGGDEFVVVLPQTGAKAAAYIAERVRRAIAQFTFLRKEGFSVRLTASFGVAAYPDHARGREDLIRVADEAMYRAKRLNRNCIVTAG